MNLFQFCDVDHIFLQRNLTALSFMDILCVLLINGGRL
nr:MAG TPA: 39S ribosomal protein L2 [Caudoviricetes sp.]